MLKKKQVWTFRGGGEVPVQWGPTWTTFSTLASTLVSSCWHENSSVSIKVRNNDITFVTDSQWRDISLHLDLTVQGLPWQVLVALQFPEELKVWFVRINWLIWWKFVFFVSKNPNGTQSISKFQQENDIEVTLPSGEVGTSCIDTEDDTASYQARVSPCCCPPLPHPLLSIPTQTSPGEIRTAHWSFNR